MFPLASFLPKSGLAQLPARSGSTSPTVLGENAANETPEDRLDLGQANLEKDPNPAHTNGLARVDQTKSLGLLALANKQLPLGLVGAGGNPFGMVGVVAAGLCKDGKLPQVGYVAIHSIGGPEAGEAFLSGDPTLARALANQQLVQDWLR